MTTLTENLFKHKSTVEIRFVDVDLFGHVNNANYLTYIEQARLKYFEDILEWPYDWSKEGVILARAEVDFVMPIRMKDEVTIMTRCARMGNKSFDLQYRIIKMMDGKEILMADAFTVMVAFDYVNNSSIPVPAEWRNAINKFEGSSF